LIAPEPRTALIVGASLNRFLRWNGEALPW
jgi:hypothetical protein